ncbi:17277_t:CDS:2, partial [Acaulospora morrowiae]
MFSSNLPEDLVIQFHVKGSYIVNLMYALQFHLLLSQQKNSNILQAHKQPSKMCHYKDKYTSILEEVSVKSPDPKLVE